jgi:hypothetical protein
MEHFFCPQIQFFLSPRQFEDEDEEEDEDEDEDEDEEEDEDEDEDVHCSSRTHP